jgi:hypothetical protein
MPSYYVLFFISKSYQIYKQKESDDLLEYNRKRERKDIYHDEENEDIDEACDKKRHKGSHSSKEARGGNKGYFYNNSPDKSAYGKDNRDYNEYRSNQDDRSQGGWHDANYDKDDCDKNRKVGSDRGRYQNKAFADGKDGEGRYSQFDRDRYEYYNNRRDCNQYTFIQGDRREDRNYGNCRQPDGIIDRGSSDEDKMEKIRAEELKELKHKMQMKSLKNEAEMEEDELKRKRNSEEQRLYRLHIEYLVAVKSQH